MNQVCLKDLERQRVSFEDSRSGRGHGVHFKGRGKVYAESVRLRGGVMLVVRVTKSGVPFEREELELTLCGRAVEATLYDLMNRMKLD